MPKRCVVTGGAGVIGQDLVVKLHDLGHRVRVVDLLPRPDRWPAKVEYVQGDLVDLGTGPIVSFNPDTIYHLAATFERSVEAPDFWGENARNNVAASASVLAAATECPNLRRYVFASSYLIYDPKLYLNPEPVAVSRKLRESDAIFPRNVTGAAKLLHELEVDLASSGTHSGFSAVCARIYRVYGPSSRDVISRWIRAALAGEGIDVYGDQARFDYVYSSDVAEGLVRLEASSATGVVNLGSGRSRSVREVVDCLRSHFSEINIREERPTDCYEASEADTTRLKELTDWVPPTQLEYGISQLVQHERHNARNKIVNRRVSPPRRLNAMVSSASSKSSIFDALRRAYRSLNLAGVLWAADANPLAATRVVADESWVMPSLRDLGISILIDFCHQNDVKLIIPTRDGELRYYASNAPALAAAGVYVPIGSPESVERCIDKLTFHSALKAVGIPVIDTATSVEQVCSERLVVKPREGAGGAGIELGINSHRAALLLRQDPTLIVQPMIEGTEFSVDQYTCADGTTIGTVVRERQLVVHGESQVTTVVNNEAVASVAAAAVEALGVRGHSVTQVIASAAGPQVLECNARVGGASNASWVAGLRSIDAMCLEALGERVPPTAVTHRLTSTRLSSDVATWFQ